jgi:hypothetical protein
MRSTRSVSTRTERSYSRRISRSAASWPASISALSASSNAAPNSSAVSSSWPVADSAESCFERAGVPPSGIITCWSQLRTPPASWMLEIRPYRSINSA